MPKKALKPLQENILFSTKPFLWNGVASSEICHSKPTYLRTSLHTTLRRTKKKQARKGRNNKS